MIITFELAKILKEKGFDVKTPNYYTEDGELIYDEFYEEEYLCDESPIYFNAPTYHQLINWVFNSLGDLTKSLKGSLAYPVLFNKNIEWLEYWYNQLKNCPLRYEFKGRLLEWFRKEGNLLTIFFSSRENWMLRITIKGQQLKDGIYGEDYITYERAENQGILEIFKLIKNENSK